MTLSDTDKPTEQPVTISSTEQARTNLKTTKDTKSAKSQKEPKEIKVPVIKEVIKVDIRSRKEKFFQGDAHTVSSLNDTGEFDVLPKHANFVTLIKGYVIVDRGLPTEKKFEIDNGVLAAKTNAVDIYLEF